jgi:hypothetical protein
MFDGSLSEKVVMPPFRRQTFEAVLLHDRLKLPNPTNHPPTGHHPLIEPSGEMCGHQELMSNRRLPNPRWLTEQVLQPMRTQETSVSICNKPRHEALTKQFKHRRTH